MVSARQTLAALMRAQLSWTWLLLVASAVAADALEVAAGSQVELRTSSEELPRQEEHDEQSRKLALEAWCRDELADQSDQRSMLVHLRDEVAPLAEDEANETAEKHQLKAIEGQLAQNRAAAWKAGAARSVAAVELADQQKQVSALTAAQEDLHGASTGNGGPVAAVQALLQEFRGRERRAKEQEKEAESEAPRIADRERRLQEEYSQRATALAQHKASRLAAKAAQAIVQSALEDDTAFAANLQSVCSVGRQVYARLEADVQPVLRNVTRFITQAAEAEAMVPAVAAPSARTSSALPVAAAMPPPPRVPSAAKAVDSVNTAAAMDAAAASSPVAGASSAGVPGGLRPMSAAVASASPRKQTAGAAIPAAVPKLVELPPTPPSSLPPPRAVERAVATMAAAEQPSAGATLAAANRPSVAAAKPTRSFPEKGNVPAAAAPVVTRSAPLAAESRNRAVAATSPEAAPKSVELPPALPSSPPPIRALKTVAATPAPMDLPSAVVTPAATAAEPSPSFAEEEAVPAAAAAAVTRTVRPAAESRTPVQLPPPPPPADPLDVSSLPPPPPSRRGAASSRKNDAAAVSTLPPSPTPVVPVAPPGLEGGWQALVRKNRPAKHHFSDQAAVVDLTQTPNTYDAWRPGKSDVAVDSAAKSDLLAAERAFDEADNEGGDGGGGGAGAAAAASFLQVQSQGSNEVSPSRGGGSLRGSVGGSGGDDQAVGRGMMSSPPGGSGSGDGAGSAGQRDASRLLLEKFAASLGSSSLLEVARAGLGAAQLRRFWQKVREASGGRDDQHQAQAVSWCSEFQREDATFKERTRAEENEAILKRADASMRRVVAEREISAQQRISEVFSPGSAHLKAMLERTRGQEAETTTMFQRLRQEIRKASDAAGPSQTEDVIEQLGLAEGLATSASREVQDLMEAALSRRSDAEAARAANLVKLKATASQAAAEEATIPPRPNGGDADDSGLRERYRQMCSWTLQNVQAQRHRVKGELQAIEATLRVLGAAE